MAGEAIQEKGGDFVNWLNWLIAKLSGAAVTPDPGESCACPLCQSPLVPSYTIDGWTFGVRQAVVTEMLGPDEVCKTWLRVFCVTNGKVMQWCQATQGEYSFSRN